MEPECGRRVQVAIDMMNQMEPPQPGDTVHEHVPHVHRVVEEDDRQNEMQRRRQPTDIQQPVTTPLDRVRERLDDGSLEQIDCRRGGAREHDIARHVTPFCFADTPQRTPPFERGERQERGAHDDGRKDAPPGRAAHEAAIYHRR